MSSQHGILQRKSFFPHSIPRQASRPPDVNNRNASTQHRRRWVETIISPRRINKKRVRAQRLWIGIAYFGILPVVPVAVVFKSGRHPASVIPAHLTPVIRLFVVEEPGPYQFHIPSSPPGTIVSQIRVGLEKLQLMEPSTVTLYYEREDESSHTQTQIVHVIRQSSILHIPTKACINHPYKMDDDPMGN